MNGGLTWTPVFDDQPVASIGAVAINQDNPDIIWVGTGEGNVRNSTSIGSGMFKSIDGGKTWKRSGLERTERINRIALHPANPDIVYARPWARCGGKTKIVESTRPQMAVRTGKKFCTWTRKPGGTDVKLDPFNPDKLYASMWQHRRWPYFFKSGGPGSGLYISWNGGKFLETEKPKKTDCPRVTWGGSLSRPHRQNAAGSMPWWKPKKVQCFVLMTVERVG